MSTLPSNWSPAERKMWLLSHHAPPDMHLITDAEMEMVQGQMRRAMALEIEVNQTIKELEAGGYWLTEPTLHDAAAAAVFDARRNDRIAKEAFKVLKELAGIHIPQLFSDRATHEVREEIDDLCAKTISFCRRERELCRDRTAPTPENPNPNPL